MRNAGRAIPLDFCVFPCMQAVTASKLQDDLGIVKDHNMQLQAQLSAAQSSASEQVRLFLASNQRKTREFYKFFLHMFRVNVTLGTAENTAKI